MDIKKYPFITFSRETEGDLVVMAEFSSNLKVDLAIAKELVACRHDFTENHQHYLLIDFSNIQSVAPDAKIFLQNPETGMRNILGSAFIASNPVSALLANIFVKTPKIEPSRFFSNRKEALAWIKDLMESSRMPQ